MNANSKRNLYGRITIFLVGLGFASVGLGSLLKGQSANEGLGDTFGSGPIVVLVGLLAMGAAVFMKDSPAEDRLVRTGKRSRKR